MVFYNFYKILKDMIRTLFGKNFLKIIIFTILILFVLFFLNSKNVFALSPPNVTYNQETHCIVYNNVDYKINDDIFTMPYLLFFEDTRNTSFNIRIIASREPFFLYNYNNSGNYYLSFNETSDIYWLDVTYYENHLPVLSTYTLFDYNHSTLTPSGWIGNNYISQENILYLNFDIYDYYNQQDLLFSSNATPQYTNPTLSNSITELENLNFSNFIINANSYTDEIENNDGTLFMLFYNKSLDKTTVDYLYPIKEKGFTKGSIYTDYKNSTSDNMVFSFPLFMSGVFFNVGSTYQIRFAKQNYNAEYGINTYEYLGEPYTFTISSKVSQDYINQVNQQTATSTDEENQNNISNAINNQTQNINNIDNTINNSDVDNSSIDLPTDNTQDITQTGVDNIFQTIYNSFTSGTAQDIVFPIPFTNKNITLQANYIYNMLQNNNASWIINIIQAFWWYMISRFIITDIMGKIRKIKQGNFDNIQNSNIKEDML